MKNYQSKCNLMFSVNTLGCNAMDLHVCRKVANHHDKHFTVMLLHVYIYQLYNLILTHETS